MLLYAIFCFWCVFGLWVFVSIVFYVVTRLFWAVDMVFKVVFCGVLGGRLGGVRDF